MIKIDDGSKIISEHTPLKNAFKMMMYPKKLDSNSKSISKKRKINKEVKNDVKSSKKVKVKNVIEKPMQSANEFISKNFPEPPLSTTSKSSAPRYHRTAV